jgi:hypothetical protein
VNKKRKQENNVQEEAATAKPVEVGAVWSGPMPVNRKSLPGPVGMNFALHAGHFTVNPNQTVPASTSITSRAPSLRFFSGARMGNYALQSAQPTTPVRIDQKPKTPSAPSPTPSQLGLVLPIHFGREQ